MIRLDGACARASTRLDECDVVVVKGGCGELDGDGRGICGHATCVRSLTGKTKKNMKDGGYDAVQVSV